METIQELINEQIKKITQAQEQFIHEVFSRLGIDTDKFLKDENYRTFWYNQGLDCKMYSEGHNQIIEIKWQGKGYRTTFHTILDGSNIQIKQLSEIINEGDN